MGVYPELRVYPELPVFGEPVHPEALEGNQSRACKKPPVLLSEVEVLLPLVAEAKEKSE